MKIRPLALVMADNAVNTILPIPASDLPDDVRRDAQRLAGSAWSEVYQPLSSREGCRYGCKVHMRRQGAVVRFAVWHSTSYGHPKTAD